MISIAKNINMKIRLSPLIRENPPSVNFLLALLLIGYFTAGADLCKEIAFERNEIELVSGILEDSLQADFSSILDYIKTGHLYTALLPLSLNLFLNGNAGLLPCGRAPPENSCSIFQLSI